MSTEGDKARFVADCPTTMPVRDVLNLPDVLLDALPLAVYVCDQQGLLVRYNRRASELWGRAPKLGDPAEQFWASHGLYRLDGVALPLAECPMANALQTGIPVRDQEVVMERSDGSRCTVVVNISPIKDDRGEIIGAVNCFAEATERGRLGQCLRGPPLHDPRELLTSMPAAIYSTDAEGRITYYNEAAVELWGCRPELGKSEFCGSWKLYWPDGTPLPHDECPMALALKQRRPIRGKEAVAERPDGTRVPFVPYPTPLFDAAGNLVGAINMLVDISERKRWEQSLSQRTAEQAALYRFTDRLFRARTASDVYDAALDAIIAVLECQRAAVLLFDEQGVMRFVAWRGLSEGYRRVVEGHSPWARETEDPAPICIDDVESCDLDPALKQTVRAERIGALAFLPLVVQGELIGQFMAYHDAPHDFGAAELDLASIIARQIGFGIARMQAESSRQRLAAIVEASEDAIVSKSLDGIVESWNRGAERLFGYVAHEVIGKPITIIIPPERRGEEPSILDCVRLGRRVEPYETLRRRKDGSLVDVSLTVSPVKDASGRIVGASKIARDISERKRTEALMASQRQALEMAASRTPLMEVLDFLARAAESHSRQASRVAIHLLDPTGQSFERTAAPSLPSGYASAVDGMGIASAAVPCCIAASSRKRVVVSDVAASNEFPTFAEFALPLGIRSGWSIPILSSLGQVLGTVAHYYGHVRAADSRDDMLGDIIARTAGIIIERTQAEEAIARSEERFRSLVSVITDVPWSADADGAFVVPQPAWSRYTGQSWDEHRQFGWTNAFHPDDRAGVLQKWEAARVARSLYESCGRLWHAASQSYRWFEARATPLLSADGCVREWVGTCTDVDDRKKAQARQELLTEEIQHRTKNLFAVVQAVISRSFVGKQTVEEAERAVLSRLHSLGQTHVLLMDGEWQGADIAEIVATEMSPYLGRVVTQGPSVNLNAKSAQTFSLALHELATNSAKYGALSSTVGVVDINWSIVNTNGSGIFTFQWQERGGPLVAPPTRKGFGRTVLEQVMAELFEPCITFAPGGVRYELSAPLDNIIASLRDGNERPVGDTVKAEQVGGGERDHVISGHGRRAELPEPD